MPMKTKQATYDYVIIGGGVSSLGVIAELVDYRKGKSILVVDQHKQLGGQWNDAYDYVRLHGHTWTYTVQGFPWPAEIEANRGHQASKQELLTYFKGIEDHFVSQGVEILFEHMMPTKFGELQPDGSYKVTLTSSVADETYGPGYYTSDGATFEITAKKLILCTHTRHNSPPFRKIKGDAAGKPVPNNIYPYQITKVMNLPEVIKTKQKVAIIGGGKTGADAIMYLHRQGLALDQFVWVKKHDLAYALRVPPDVEKDLEGRVATFWSLLLCVWRGGLNNRICVCTRNTPETGKPREYGQPRAPIMATTGGGLLGPEELEVLRPVEQIISGIKTNAPGKIELENGQTVPCDWVVWCHGYDVEVRLAEIPRGEMDYYLFLKGCFIPMNFFAGAATGTRRKERASRLAQSHPLFLCLLSSSLSLSLSPPLPHPFLLSHHAGGRALGRAFLLYEDGILKEGLWAKYYMYLWAFWMHFCAFFGGAANSTTWWLKGGIMERVFLHWILYSASKGTPYKEFGETSLSSTELFWPRRFRSLTEMFCYW